MLSVAVITPTIATSTLEQCLKSVEQQTYSNITHHVFVDGKDNFDSVNSILKKNWNDKMRVNILDENIGKGWYGHRVYAASSFLVNQDVLIYLDEDNWLKPDHVESLMKLLNEKPHVQWAFSLRSIYNVNGEYLCDDDCESLGKWPTFHNQDVYHIDTSSFAVRRNVGLNVGQFWYGQWGADRQFFQALKTHFPNFECNKKHTLCYRLGGNEGSVSADFFLEGNKRHLDKYGSMEEFPWRKETYDIGPGIRIHF